MHPETAWGVDFHAFFVVLEVSEIVFCTGAQSISVMHRGHEEVAAVYPDLYRDDLWAIPITECLFSLCIYTYTHVFCFLKREI